MRIVARLMQALGRHGDEVADSNDFVPPDTLDRALSVDEDAALRWILWLEDFPGAEELRAQVSRVRAASGRTTELQLEVTDAARAPVADGRIPTEALVVDSAEIPIGHISVWVTGGYLDYMEYSWFTDKMPTDYPAPDQLRILDW